MQQRRRRQRISETHKGLQNNNFSHESRYIYFAHFFAVLARLRRKNS